MTDVRIRDLAGVGLNRRAVQLLRLYLCLLAGFAGWVLRPGEAWPGDRLHMADRRIAGVLWLVEPGIPAAAGRFDPR